jgi:hypothetical protein
MVMFYLYGHNISVATLETKLGLGAHRHFYSPISSQLSQLWNLFLSCSGFAINHALSVIIFHCHFCILD